VTARGRSRGRSARGGSRLPSARVEWLPLSDATADTTMTFNAANNVVVQQMYDFGSALKYADNFGGGDWTVTRMLGSLGTTPTVGTVSQIIKVCFGIGMVQGVTSVADTVDATNIAAPASNPDLSWMVYVCCYIDINNQVELVKCDWDVRSQRRISPESKMFAVAQVTPALAGAEVLELMWDARLLLRQRGSRL